MKKQSNNKKKEPWYPVLKKNHLLAVLRHQGILSWLDTYNIPQATIEAIETDILEFVNRACRAVKIMDK